MCIRSTVLVVMCLVALACGSADREPGAGDSDLGRVGNAAGAERREDEVPFPAEALLCMIVFEESTPADVEVVLGQASHKRESGQGGVNLFFDYADGAMIFLGFQEDVLVDAAVDDAPYPSCWRAQEQALLDELRRVQSMRAELPLLGWNVTRCSCDAAPSSFRENLAHPNPPEEPGGC
jgi:hypothetical protein